ncbi:hypothetical protein LCGC14_2239830 [marine sediment metagenome]|uniref:Uncharacterized protein n=1 Tax=marine sediment metagenome TaxID=412755 RepID=A0A0F9DTC6_9ZZZZ
MNEDGLGARLRDWINEGAGRWITMIVAVLVVGGAVAVFVKYSGGPGSKARAAAKAGRRSYYVCPACDAKGEMRVPYGVKWPVACPKCKEVKAIAGILCRKCSKIIPAVDKPFFRCPECGATFDTRFTDQGNPAPPPL